MASLEVGQRVVRSATWSWKGQDGGEGHLGTVVKLTDQDPVTVPEGWAKVRWDNGYCNNYQVGTGGNFDLLLFDSAPAGVVHSDITCDSCKVHSIAGMRWKCSDESCPDFDLCTPCYMNDKHDLMHQFTRFTCHKEAGTQVASRVGEDKTDSKGLCLEAEVSRGEDWQGGDEDGGNGGTVVETCAISDRPRSGVTVSWSQSKLVTTHRVGYDGKVDLKCNKPGTGISFYSRHLPILGKHDGLKVGDHVAITLDSDTLRAMLQTRGCEWSSGMNNLFGKIAKVTGIRSYGKLEVTYPGIEHYFIFHADVLNKVPLLEKGDRVRVNTDLKDVMNLQKKSRNGWVTGMEKCLGKEGTVVRVDEHLDTMVHLTGFSPSEVSWHPCTLTLVKKNSSNLMADDDKRHIKTFCDVDVGNSSDDEMSEDVEGSQLVRAAKFGDLGRVLEILSSLPEKVNAKFEGKTALHKASLQGHLEVVKALLEAGAEIESTTEDGHTPLHYSVEGDEPAVTKYLIEKGADMDRGSARERRAIHRAAYGNIVDCARILINHGCDVNVKSISKDTPLHEAVYKNSVDVVELLLNVPNIDITLTNNNEMTPLQFAAGIGRPELAGLIAQHCPASIPVPQEDGDTILHIAAVNNNVEVMKVVLAVGDHGLCLDTQNEQGLTALHLAAHEGYSESVEFLISQGADINVQCNDDHSPLHLLASAARNDPSNINETPTLRKIKRQYRDGGVGSSAAALLCFMVLHGASIDTENVKCRTPIYYIEDPKLRRTLKQIARGERANDMESWEDRGEDEDVKRVRMSSNAIPDDDVTVERNDSLGQDPDSPKHFENEIAASGEEPDHPPRIPTKFNKPKIGVFDLVHEIKVSDLDMGPVVGRGQFGVVHRASWRGTPVAVKKISMLGSKKDEVEKEVAIHRQATHPNIVKIMALGYEGQEACIVMQLIEGASLSTIIFPDRDDPKIPLDWPKKLQISREVLQAVTFMHASNILHLDIKPANILVETDTTRPFICDLGLAHIKNRNAMTQYSPNMRGTPNFMPPEALTASADPGYRHSKKHDIWSVAGTIVELFSMKRLWGDSMHPMALLALAAAGKMGKPESLAAVDTNVKQILDPCFNQKPEERPSASDLLDQFNDMS